MSVKRCQVEVDAEEFGWWKAVDAHEPIGREAQVLATGLACIANQMAAACGGKGPWLDRWDFLPPGTARPGKTLDANAMEAAASQMSEAATKTTRPRRP